MSELRQTDLPWPVAPATSMCGIEARSATSSRPSARLPKRSGSSASAFFHASDSKISRKEMPAGARFGTSMPMHSSPGIGASMRSDFACSAPLMLSARLVTAE